MASGGRESNVFSSDDESLHSVKKRQRRPKVLVSSDSDDESVLSLKKRQRRPKVLVSSDSDDDSDFEVRTRKTVKPLDYESEDSIENLNNSSEPRFCSNNEEEFSALNDTSDNEQSEKCAICLSKFSGQDIATPETCDHMFCLECLQEWAKNVNTCPIDRLKFNLILIRHHKEEKIFKRIFVNCAELWLYESESESDSNVQTPSCGYCGEHENIDAMFPCHECLKTFHFDCLLSPPIQLSSSSMICPNCASCIRMKRFKSSRRLDLHNRRYFSNALGMENSEGLTEYSYNRGLRRLHQKTQELIQRLKRRFVISSSESSEDEVQPTSRTAIRLFQDEISSKSLCPLIQKRRREFFRSQNRTLISSTASAASNSELYSVDSDDGISDMRYDSYDRVLVQHGHPSSTSRDVTTSQTRDKMISSNSTSDSFDVVGTILQNQTLLHRSDILALKRDGSLLLNSDSPLNSPSATASVSNIEKSKENSSNPFFKSSVFDNKSVLPYSGGAVYNQRPMNPSQNTNSKYRETPRENYSCSSSTTSIDPSIDYDNRNISSRNTLDSGNERYNNENSCSSVIHKSFCGASATDEIKKSSSSFKESAKGHHSEEEVDIYSDIESVGEDDGVCNTIGVDDRIEPMKMQYKDDESPSNHDAASDSSDNELIIDEDTGAEDEADNQKELYPVNNSDNKHEIENEHVNESGDSNVSYSEPLNQEQAGRGTPDVHDENCSYVDSRSVEDSQPCEESSQETQDSTGPEEYKNGPDYDEGKNESEYDEGKNESEYDENKNGSDEEEKNESDGEDKNRSEDEDRNESDDEDKNESDTGGNKNGSECDQESDMDVQVYEENSMDSPKKSPRAGTSTPCSTVSSKQYDEDLKQSLGHYDNSVSSENQECDTASDAETKREKEITDMSSMQVNENTSDSISQAEGNENNSNYSFESAHNVSEPEEAMDSNIDASQTFSETDRKEFNEACSDVDMKSDYPEEDGNTANDDDDDENVDYSENAGTPCLDENIDGQLENSPVHDTLQSTDQDFKSHPVEAGDFDQKSDRTSTSACEYELGESDKTNEQASEDYFESNTEKVPENSVDLGIEDISEAGSGDLDDDFADENLSFSENKDQGYNDEEREDNINVDDDDDDPDSKVNSKHLPEDLKYQTSQNSNQSFEEHEEGEIIEEKPICRPNRKHGKKFDCYRGDNEDYGAPRLNISDLPRIPKIKRDREKEVPEEIPIEAKRTSVLGRVDLGGGDISWKRLSKHTRERSYRDGRPKDDRMLYRERESRKKDKKYTNVNEWRSDSKSTRREDTKKQDSEKLRSEYESRSRKSDKKEKVADWSYSERDKRSKSHKDKHRDKHKEKKEKIKHDKNKYSKDEVKYGREKVKDEDHYERELRFDKEQRFERIVYEKGKFKEKEHKSKHKDRKGDSKSGKDHSREKHKHVHTNEHFSDKQREREVRKIDDKIKIVVEQKEGRKEKSKHKDKKESKHDKKQIHHHDHRKKEIERSPYTELSSIESKEIFAKGDSIIINVNFNRTSSPKDLNIIENADSSFKDRKSIEEIELDEIISTTNEKSKGKHSLVDKGKALDTSLKRPTTPPERTNQVLSVSECYWQGGEDSDANNSVASEKSVEEVPVIEEENETMESADAFEGDSSCNSVDLPESQTTPKEGASESEETIDKPDKVDSSFSKEAETVIPSKRRSPRSPSPPSPADNDSYDPCEPTRSPSPPPIPPAPPLPLGNPKPPPSPELPPLPPEPEPIDNIREETLTHKQNTSEFVTASSVVASTSSQAVTVNSQTSVANPISLPSILLPPPSFLSHTATTSSLPTLSSLLTPRNFNFQVSGHPNVIFPPNHVHQVIQGLVPSQMHAGTAIPPPPNPPSLPHMGAVPPPPPPPSAMALISSVRHPQLNVRPALPPNSLLQNLTMGHPVTVPQMQMSHLHHMPPNFSNPLNHQSPMLIQSQNQPVSLPVSIQNQPISRVMLSQNQILNHSIALQNQNNIISKPQSSVTSLQIITNSTPQKLDKISAAERSEVVDMEMDSPYSPGDSPSMDSMCDYSPTCSPLPSSPKNKDIFDTLLPADHRTIDRKSQESSSKLEKSKRSESKGDGPSKKLKHEHKSDSSKVRHSVRMQVSDKNRARKEQKTEKKLDDSQLKILDELPSSAVEMQVKEKFLKKLNRQERVVEEVKLALKPYYKSRDVTKEEYKDILRKSVPKIYHNKSGEINPRKVKNLVDCYIKKIKHSRKKSEKKKSSKLS